MYHLPFSSGSKRLGAAIAAVYFLGSMIGVHAYTMQIGHTVEAEVMMSDCGHQMVQETNNESQRNCFEKCMNGYDALSYVHPTVTNYKALWMTLLDSDSSTTELSELHSSTKESFEDGDPGAPPVQGGYIGIVQQNE